MTVFLYSRVSTTGQNLSAQTDALQKAYPDGVLREEKASATSMERPVLQLMLDMMHSGDKLVVWKLDRLARSMKDLTDIVHLLESKGASIEIIDQSIDTSTASGKAFLQMLGVFAEFETNLRRERQMAGIAKARAEGRMGAAVSVDDTAIWASLDEGLSYRKVATKLGCSLSSVQRSVQRRKAA